LPQLPQFCAFDATSTHPDPQYCWPLDAQPHVPDLQTCPVAHALPHAPQFCRSDETSTHPEAQSFWVEPGQAHAPVRHTRPTAHATPQPPQLVGSVCVSTQAPPHEFVGGHSHLPATHVCPTPPAPHWAFAGAGSSMTPLQSSSLPLQISEVGVHVQTAAAPPVEQVQPGRQLASDAQDSLQTRPRPLTVAHVRLRQSAGPEHGLPHSPTPLSVQGSPWLREEEQPYTHPKNSAIAVAASSGRAAGDATRAPREIMKRR
jgi:hypothetical protein